MSELEKQLSKRGLRPFPNVRFYPLFEGKDKIYSDAFVIDWVSLDNRISRTQIRDKSSWHNLSINSVSTQIYNINDTINKPIVFLTESVFDAQSIIQSISEEYKLLATAVAYGTANLFSQQFMFTKYAFENKTIVLAFDNDFAGLKMKDKILEKMGDTHKIRVMVYPYKDPNQLLIKDSELLKTTVNQVITDNL